MIDSIKKSMESMGYKNIQNNKKVDETHSRCENLNKKI